MQRLLILLSTLLAAAALAASPALRQATIAGLRAIAEPLFDHGVASEPQFDAFYTGMVEAMSPQQKAEQALQMAINRRVGAAEYLIANAPGWTGQFQPSPTLAALLLVAGDSPLIEVRMAAMELSLAQYGLEKSPDQIDQLLQRLQNDPENSSAWALWNIGVLGARGVQRERVFATLSQALRSADDNQRHWAVEGLAKFGGVEIIGPMLDTAANEASAYIRERAFCALAQSGTLQLVERYEAVPGLFAIASDPRSDPQSRGWAYQALREITETGDLPNLPEPWRERLRFIRAT